jgi:tRNA pseudouridine65 synthase
LEFEIIFQDENLIAINKPYGYFVHQSRLDPYTDQIILPLLRNQIGMHVHPVHRLDRKTTGVLLFGKNKVAQSNINQLFREGLVKKEYQAIVRGWINQTGHIDYPITNEDGKTQEAVTDYSLIAKSEINISSGKYPTSRYSLVSLVPVTGRQHQLRKHMAHILHPIIGDRPHGCNKQNKFFKEQYMLDEMMLHATKLSFNYEGKEIIIEANYSSEFNRIQNSLNLI